MKPLPASHSAITPPRRRRFRGQGLVEFALVLPVMLIVIFVIVELARVFHAWLAVENGARFGVRYAITGEYDDLYCAIFPLGICDEQDEEDAARIPSVKDATRAGSVAILRNESLLPGQPGYYKVTVCSNKGGVVYFPSDPNTNLPADCQPGEDPGGPGDRVSVTVDFDHPLIVPIISSWWPQVHLTAKREGIVEQFRVARVVGLPATIALPSFTPTETPTPTDTPTATEIPPPTETPTITHTATKTPTPDCSLLYCYGARLSGDDFEFRVRNNNSMSAYLTYSELTWNQFGDPPSTYFSKFRLCYKTYYDTRSYSSPVVATDEWEELEGTTRCWWEADFNRDIQPYGGYYSGDLIFKFPDWPNQCPVSCSISATAEPTRTPTRTPTWGPSPTRTPTRTPRPSRTPTRTPTWGPSPTRTVTRTPRPSRTPTAIIPTSTSTTICTDC